MSLSSTIAPTEDAAAIPCPIPEPKPAKPIDAPTPIAIIPACKLSLVASPPNKPENTKSKIATKNP